MRDGRGTSDDVHDQTADTRPELSTLICCKDYSGSGV